jgi:RNA polymerase sigma factor (sigma-70 family)
MTAVPRRMTAPPRPDPQRDAGCPIAADAVTVADAATVADSLRLPEQFAKIYASYFADIYQYVAGRLGPDAADDLAAETFLIAFRRRTAFDPTLGSVRPWLYGIATNLVAQHRRREIRRYRALGKAASAQPRDDDEGERVADRLTAAGLRGPLASALADLPARDRDVLLLVALGGLSYQEISAALSISPGTVGSRLNRARRKTRAALAGLYPVPQLEDSLDARRGNNHVGHR